MGFLIVWKSSIEAAMEAEERPAKIRKLSYDDDDGDGQKLPQDLPRGVGGDHEKQPVKDEKIESANGTTTHNSLPEPSKASDSVIAESDPTQVAPQATLPALDTSALSKNQLKKLRKKQEWEAGREERKIIRKEKHQERKARKRAARDEAADTTAVTNGPVIDAQEGKKEVSSRRGVPKHVSGILLPITFVIDCAFDSLMHDRERISLASQLTRSYSDNHRAPFKAHLVISSWGGELRKRFDTLLSEHYKKWRGVRVLEEDFAAAAEQSKEWMTTEKGGKLAGAFALHTEEASSGDLPAQGEVIYLTSDSENTLDRLRPYSTYIIGGLVDKNRHKGICYKSARERNIKTAKLPIGEYMNMQSRYVLATSHVVEIMVRWLECGDWGEAFLKVMPKRKGGKLKEHAPDRRGESQLGDDADGVVDAE